MAKALEGINVVESSAHPGAADAAMLIAEHGARAVRVEPPAGAADRGTPHFHVVNRGKRAVALDLDSDVGRGEAEALVSRAELVVAGNLFRKLSRMSCCSSSAIRAASC